MKKITFQVIKEAYTGPGVLINSEFLNKLKVPDQLLETIKFLEEKNLGKKKLILD